MKRLVERPWGTKRNGGWVVGRDYLVESCRKAEVCDIGGVQVGSKKLVSILKLLPHEYCHITANHTLEVETLQMVMRKRKDGHRKAGYSKPKHNYCSFRLFDGAWVTQCASSIVVIKPKPF